MCNKQLFCLLSHCICPIFHYLDKVYVLKEEFDSLGSTPICFLAKFKPLSWAKHEACVYLQFYIFLYGINKQGVG